MKGNIMFSLDTVNTETWYEIKWTDTHGNTGTVERPDSEAASYLASLLTVTGNTLVSFTALES